MPTWDTNYEGRMVWLGSQMVLFAVLGLPQFQSGINTVSLPRVHPGKDGGTLQQRLTIWPQIQCMAVPEVGQQELTDDQVSQKAPLGPNKLEIPQTMCYTSCRLQPQKLMVSSSLEGQVTLLQKSVESKGSSSLLPKFRNVSSLKLRHHLGEEIDRRMRD